MKAHLIYNPTAGPWDVSKALDQLRSDLRSRGWSVESSLSHQLGDTTRLARMAADEGCDVVLVTGGDGTVNEAVNGLVGTDTALGTIPVGTGNVWAKQLGFRQRVLTNPFRLREVVDSLADGSIRTADVGLANGRYFLCWTGVGFDAQVTTEMEPRSRNAKRLGMLPYAIAAVMVASDFPGVRAHVVVDGAPIRTRSLLILVSNIRLYCGGLDIAPEGRVDDGLFDVFIFKGLGFRYAVRHFVGMLSQRSLQDPEVIHRQARHVDITTEPTMPVQLDGDPLDHTPVSVRIVPRSLRVLVPSTAPRDLFGQASYPVREKPRSVCPPLTHSWDPD